MARRIYISDWADKRIRELSEKLNMPMSMVVDNAIKLLLNSEEGE